VLLTPVQEKSVIMACVNKIEISGDSCLSRAVQIGSLCLKHRANKNQRQRLIVMVASPISESVKDLENIGKKLKKSNIAMDVINLGTCQAYS
jgi:26S proteasome regulatory subunit N10